MIEIDLPGPFDIVLADPPWPYDFALRPSDHIENKYGTLNFDELIEMVPPTKDDSILFMWATAPKLLLALDLMNEWGFEYTTHAIWNKVHPGIGFWFRGQHELLLLGKRGKPKLPLKRLVPSSMFTELRRGHSRKPEIVYRFIERVWPLARRLEMFARETRPGWVCFGDELPTLWSDRTLESVPRDLDQIAKDL